MVIGRFLADKEDVKANSGVFFYRENEPLNWFKKQGHTIIDLPFLLGDDGKQSNDKVHMMMDTIQDVDLLWVTNPRSEMSLELLAQITKANLCEIAALTAGVPKSELERYGLSTKRHYILVDIDDDPFTVRPDNPAYHSYGRKDVTYEHKSNGVTFTNNMWTDGKNDFHIERNKTSLRCALECVRLADVFTSPSKKLINKFRRFEFADTKVVYNAVDPAKCKQSPYSKDGKLRILWTVSSSHLKDWQYMTPMLKWMLDTYPQIELMVMGHNWPMNGVDEKRILRVPTVTPQNYLQTFSSLTVDVGLAAVAPEKFNTYRSVIKATEHLMAGRPVLCTKTLYRTKELYGAPTLVYNNIEEFKVHIDNLITHPDGLVTMQKRARPWTVENFSQDVVLKPLEDYLKSLIGR